MRDREVHPDRPSDEMPAAAPAVSRPLSWRKRHPALARALLYGTGLVVAAVVIWLLLERREDDEAERLRGLELQLENLDLVRSMNPDGTQVLRVLEEKFADPSLPSGLRHRALRAEAVVRAQRGEHALAEAAFDRAAALDVLEPETQALRIERANARLSADDATGALALVETGRSSGTLGTMRRLTQALALERLGRVDETRRVLEASLADALAAAPDDPAVWLGLHDWTPAEAATEIVAVSTRLGAGADAWQRLLTAFPDDAEAHLRAAAALVESDPAAARFAFDRARALDPRRAEAAPSRLPALRPLAEE